MKKQYLVILTAEERKYLKEITTKGTNKIYRVKHAQALLKADQSDKGPAWSDTQICTALEIGRATIERLRKRFVEEGLETSLSRRGEPYPRIQKKLTGKEEAQMIALVCSDPPEGQARWSLRLIADKLVELEIVDSISHETVRQTLKKMKLNLG